MKMNLKNQNCEILSSPNNMYIQQNFIHPLTLNNVLAFKITHETRSGRLQDLQSHYHHRHHHHHQVERR